MTEIILFGLAVLYGIYKCIKTKNVLLSCILVVIIFSFITERLHLPTELDLSLWAFFGCGASLYRLFKMKTDKFFYTFSILFFGFGIIFLFQAIQKMGCENRLIEFLRF